MSEGIPSDVDSEPCKTWEQIELLLPEQVEQLVELYRNEWWCSERELSDVQQMLAETDLVFGVQRKEDRALIAFARVLTDFSFHAMIFDVIVAPEYRGLGLGRDLMLDIVEHPRLKSVGVKWLCCLPEMREFYERMGFSAELGKLIWMRSPSLND
ncbi:MAG: GNAT superfamily N-acetyltransferase [Pirellulaceae bacterium]|jgi:GNAT superfamily N-acetyltransferase